jgi:hydrogenase maturation protease
MEKNILILCCGYPYLTDTGFGYHVWKVLEQMKLAQNVDLMEVGFSACMVPQIIEGKDKLIIVDIFNTNDKPGTIVYLSQEELQLKGNIKKDPAKVHLIETLEQIKLSGKCPETVFIGVIPVDTETESEQLTPEIQNNIPTVIKMIMEEINSVSSK